MRDKISKARQTVAALWEPLALGQRGQGWLRRRAERQEGVEGPGTALGQAARSSVHTAVSPRTIPNTSPLRP